MALDRIVLLDENTANRIAAGEVIERPASAIKEMVENSIDAEATQITISLEEGGKRRIVITDNGTGMTRGDCLLALQRHATSKIRSADDLFSIQTLGFRGEALPSVASVSRFTVISKPHDQETGTRVEVEGGDVVQVEEVAAVNGTRIEVADLFFNTPARLKFLKSSVAETSRAVETVGHLAIAYPKVAFLFMQNGQETFRTPGDGSILSALAAIWGREIAKNLIPLEFQSPGLNVSGFVVSPDITKAGRSHELFFVNRRPIKSRLLTHALEDAFRALTPESRYPIAAVFVDIDPALVDVNVHPTKTEVKFSRDGDVHHAVSQAVKSAILAYGIVPLASPITPSLPTTLVPLQVSLALPTMSQSSIHAGEQDSISFNPTLYPIPASSESDSATIIETLPKETEQNIETPSEILQPKERPKPFAEQLRNFEVLGQAQNTYIIALTVDGLAIIDQHVAHERVLYERLTEKRFSQGIPVQRLITPITITLERREALLLTEHCEGFVGAGWDLSPFGKESFVLRSVPAMLANKPYEKILHDMIEELVNQSISRRLLVQRDHVTITNACKMAVKAGDPLSIPEMKGLLEQLADTENPYLCPHGRPIVVKLPYTDIDKLFKRS